MKSYKDIVEALKGKQHKIDKNKNGQIDAQDFKLLRKEESELTEATVKTQKYSWGTMKTVHHGADFSIPLHPEHHKEIAKLKDEQEHNFKTEDGKSWTARRKGDEVHFQGANNGGTTKVKHSDLKEEEERMDRSDYKLSPSGRKSHKEIVFKHGDDKKELDEVAPPGFEGTVKAMKKHKEIDNPYALAWYMKNKGMKSHKKASGAMKEEAEELEERNKANAIKRKMMDASRGAQYKVSGMPVPDREPQHTTASAHNKAIGRALRNEESEQVEEGYYEKPASAYRRRGDEIGGGSSKNNVPFDGPYTKTSGSTTDKSGAVHSPMSKVRHLARMAMKKQMKEQFELDITDEQADTILDAINEQAPVAPVPGDKWKNHAVMVNGKQRVVIQRKNAKNYPEHEGWKEVAPGHKIKEDDEVKFSYTELMMMLEYESKGGVYRHTGTYGSEYAKKEREKDEKGFDAEEKPTTNLTKRGRGRPAGSKSGARGPRIK